MCALDYDPPHPQETVRVKADKMVPGMTNGPDQQPDYITGFCLSRSAVAGDAIAGCAIAGRDSNDDTVPTGTF